MIGSSESSQSTLCPACGYDNIPGADDCEGCGHSLTQVFEAGASQEDASIFELPLLKLGPRQPICLPPSATVAEAVAKLRAEHMGCVLVTGEDDELVGIFTEGDVHYKVAGLIEDLSSIPIESLMTIGPSTLRASDPIKRALHLMGLHGFRHVPLVDDDEKPVGFISFRDIVRFMEESFTAS